jgi:gluconokinase
MVIIVMGVAGAGKTTVGRALAADLDWTFYDADDFHSASNVAKMRAGTPLSDEDRRPWLDALRALIDTTSARGEDVVLACSALKHAYRDDLTRGVPEVQIVFLKGDPELMRARLARRKDHYMPTGLLESQFNDLEEPTDALVIDAAAPPERAVAMIRQAIELRARR